MKKYLVIGNPIEHSLSPKLHNHWIQQNNIDAVYEKKQLNESDIEAIIDEVKSEKINGINVTVPFKKSVIPFLDQLTLIAKEAQSVNTIFKKDNKIVGDNTDIGGFEYGLKHINYDVQNKKVFILGAGGVVPSIILALKKLGVFKISLSNRTKEKAVGLKNEDRIELDFGKIKSDKLFYDVIYNPSKTNFLLKGEELGNKIENGKMMFIYQAQLSFKIWHNILPKVDDKLLD